MSKRIGLMLMLGACCYPFTVYSGPTGLRDINYIGCHKTDNTCYVYLTGSAVGPANCLSNSIRWNEASDANGKATLAMLTAAFMAGKQVNFYVNDNDCYQSQPQFPTFNYFNIAK